jgi:hypothetical protein
MDQSYLIQEMYGVIDGRQNWDCCKKEGVLVVVVKRESLMIDLFLRKLCSPEMSKIRNNDESESVSPMASAKDHVQEGLVESHRAESGNCRGFSPLSSKIFLALRMV